MFPHLAHHPADQLPRLFERGANCVGYDFLAHPFWDKYLEFEERHEAHDKIFALLQRIISIPMHQYARYFERFRLMTTTRGPEEGIPADKLAELQAEVTATIGPVARSQNDIAQALRSRIEAYQYEIFQKCQGETGARWTYEQEVKRPYFHVTELDEGQLSNWRKYLDFEEAQGDYKRIVFLYERCCVAAAYYDEFWLRYARWMARQDGKVEETRNIYQRSSCIFAPIARRTVRMQWALFEEMNGRVQVALDIYQAMLLAVPGVVEVINAWANCARRQRSMDAALQVYTSQIESEDLDRNTKAALIAESARMAWKVDGDAARARQLFRDNQGYYPNSFAFWSGFLTFELEQPSTQSTEHVQHTRIKEVFKSVRMSSLPTESIQALAQVYMVYLLERGTKDVAKEYMQLDAEINGSQVAKLTIAGKDVFMSG
jgi:pre-mRNA-processing factor 39